MAKKARQTKSTTVDVVSPVTSEAAKLEHAVLAQVAKGDQLRIEDRDGKTAQFACTMTVTRVTNDKIFCGSTAFRKSDGQELGGNDHMFAMPVSATKSKAGKQATAAKAAKKPAKARPQDGSPKLSALDAAAKVLGETGQPMNCRDLVDQMSAKGYWTSPGGATPWATLNAAISREIKVKGSDSRFTKADRGQFARKV
jgi:hypothetical protein